MSGVVMAEIDISFL